jgi:hypothetical protein
LSSALDGDLISGGIGFVTGIVTTIFAGRIQQFWRRLYLAARDLPGLRPHIFDYDPTTLGQFQINSWSTERSLTKVATDISIAAAAPRQTWCDELQLKAKRDEIPESGGPSWFLTDFAIDNRESHKAQKFRVTLAESSYRDYRALTHLLSGSPDVVSALKVRASQSDGLRDLVRGSPPTTLGVHVNVVSAEDTFLAFRRSGAVGENQGTWQLGCGETISSDDIQAHRSPGSEPQSFHPFCIRALREEVGLEANEYGEIRISWMGIDLRQGLDWMIAHVVSKLSQVEIERRLNQAHGNFEMTEWVWLSFRNKPTRDLLREMEASDRSQLEGGPAPSRLWVAGQRLVLRELHRYRPVLQADRYPVT